MSSQQSTHDIELPQGYDARPWDYDGQMYTEGQIRAAIEADRKRRGGPVAYGIKAANTGEIVTVLYGSDVDQVGEYRADLVVPLYTTPQPAESCASLMSDKTACGSENGDCDSQPAEPDLAKCAECGAEMIHVRPGKWQHPDCPQSPRAAEPVSNSLSNGLPEGHVLVPKHPTATMLSAAQRAWLQDPLRRTTTLWDAMLAAAPKDAEA